MDARLKITAEDGTTKIVPLFCKGGYAPVEQFKPDPRAHSQIHAGYAKLVEQRRGYQQGILDRIEQYKLWQYMDEPGRMADEYRKNRRNEPEFKELVTIARIHVEQGEVTNTAREPKDYVLPGRCFRGHSINADFLIDLELNEVFTFVLRNTRPDPYKDPKNRLVQAEELARRYEEATLTIQTPGSTGANVLHLGPGRCFPIPLAADKDINPRPLPESGLVLERYEHWNPEHNRNLADHGAPKGLEIFGDSNFVVTSGAGKDAKKG